MAGPVVWAYLQDKKQRTPDQVRIQEFEAHYKLDPELEHLEFGASQWDRENISGTEIRNVAEKCLKLKSLSLSNLKSRLWLAGGFFSSPIYFPNLTFLHFSGCEEMDDAFRLVAPLLKRLEIYDNAALKDIQVRVQFSAQISIRTLFPKFDIERIPLEDSDLELIKDAPAESVEFLDLSYCPKITDSGLNYLRNLRPKKLSLRGCQKLTTAGIANLIASVAEGLRSVDLGELPQLRLLKKQKIMWFPNPEGLHEWVPTLTLTPIRHLDLSDHPELTDPDFWIYDNERHRPVYPWERHTQWISLSVSNCCKLTDKFFRFLFCLKFLRELKANNLPLITDEGLKELNYERVIFITNNTLVKLSIAKCKQVTDAGLKALEPIKTLRMLNVKGCPLVTLRGVQSLQKAIPGIQILHDLDSTAFKKE